MQPGYLFLILANIRSIAHWKTAGVFDIPKNITDGSYTPSVLRFPPSFDLPYHGWLTSDLQTLDSLCLPSLRPLLSRHFLSCTILTHRWRMPLCTCNTSLYPCLPPLMYISARTCALGTLSEFSSVPILVADELASTPWLVNHNPRGIPYFKYSKSRTIVLTIAT